MHQTIINNTMNKTALITGASSGIGKELASIHAKKGGNLILVARRGKVLDEIKTKLEGQHNITVTTIVKDLSKSGSAKELYEEVKSKNLQVDYLINNAGFGLRGLFHELPLDRQQQMMQLNMITLTELTHLFLPEMISRNNGKILNTSSTASLMPGPLQAVYFATKAYVTSLSNALAEELSNTNITITNFMPGATETEFAKTADMDKTDLFAKVANAHSVASEGYDAMIKGYLDVISGLNFGQKMMMRMIPFAPKKITLKRIKNMQTVK